MEDQTAAGPGKIFDSAKSTSHLSCHCIQAFLVVADEANGKDDDSRF